MQKDFISVNPDNGNGSATVTVSASANSGAARSTSIMISGGGMTRPISITQGSRYATFTDITYTNNPNKSLKLQLKSQTDTSTIEIKPNDIENVGIPNGLTHLMTYLNLSENEDIDMKLTIAEASISNVNIRAESYCALNIKNGGNGVEILVYGDYEAVEMGGWSCYCTCDLTINGHTFTNVIINCDCLD